MSLASLEKWRGVNVLGLSLFPDPKKTFHILCLGAHCDDIEIGCGGTLLKLSGGDAKVRVTWVVFTSNDERKKEATAAAKLFTEGSEALDLTIHKFRDGFLPYNGEEIKNLFEEIKNTIDTPDIIFTHYRQDLHQDHRKINELTWNTFRNHLILEYEIPKWDGDMGTPNTFVPLPKETCAKKIEYLQKFYNTQQAKSWFTDDLFWSMLRIRGMECSSPTLHAEAFYSRKLIVSQ